MPNRVIPALALGLTLFALGEARTLPRDTGASTWNDVKGAFDPSRQFLWDPQTGPKDMDISQGGTGDCWLDASLASVAYADQKQIEKVMNDPKNSDGTVTVTLSYKDKSAPYEVKKKVVTDDRSGYSDAAPQTTGLNLVWPAAMEDAFTAFAKDHPDTQIPTSLNGGNSLEAFPAIYGDRVHITYHQTGNTGDNDLWALFLTAKTKPTTTSSNSSKDRLLDNGLPSNHMYSVRDCDKNKGVVTLRNPWGMVSNNDLGIPNGGGHGITDKGDGVFDISFPDWKKYFADITTADI